MNQCSSAMDISALCTHERLKTRMNMTVMSVTSCGYLHAHSTVFMMRNTVCLMWIWSVSSEPDKFNCITDISVQTPASSAYVVLHIVLPDCKPASDDQMMEKSVTQVCSVVKLFIQSGVLTNIIFYQHEFIDRSTLQSAFESQYFALKWLSLWCTSV